MGGLIMFIIIIVLWGITALLAYADVSDAVHKLDDDDKKTVFIIFMICGPAFAITTIANIVLNNILPEGWDDDGDDFIKKY